MLIEAHKTIPWSDNEFVKWHGFSLVYTFKDGRTMVHFPGGAELPFEKLPGAVYPKCPRMKQLVA